MFLIRQNTKVLLEDGSVLPIGDVKIGHRLQGAEKINEVLGVRHSTVHASLWEIHDRLVGISADQPIMSRDGWVAVGHKAARQAHPYLEIAQLHKGNELLTQDKDYIPTDYITGLDDDGSLVAVELELDGDHTYYVNGFLVHNKGDSGGGGTTTNITKTDPPAYLQPYLTDIAKSAQTAYQQVPTGGFSGQLVAAPTTAQMTALDQQKSIAGALGPNFGQNTLNLGSGQIDKINSGYFTQAANNTYNPTNVGTADAVNAYLAPVQEKLQEQIIPGVQSAAINQGAYGGSRYFNEMGNQINDNFTKEAGNIAAQIGYGEAVRQDDMRFKGWETNQALMPELLKIEQAASLTAPEIMNAGVTQSLTPSSLLASAGQAEQLFTQDTLDEAYNQYILDVMGPFAGLDQYASIVGGMPMGGMSTSTGTMSKPSGGSNFLSGALGGGMAAYGLSSMAPALGFLGGPMGIAGGAILGGLLGGM